MAAANQSKTTTVRRFPWLYMARCVMASVVTVLAVAVVVRAVVVVRRPRLQLKLTGGLVEVDYIPSLPPPENLVKIRFVLRTNNPRASVKYANVTVRFTDVDRASSPRITMFDLPKPIAVPQGTMTEVSVVVTLTAAEDLPMRYVRAFYEGRRIEDAEMELRGVLVSDAAVLTTTYYCWPVTFAVGADCAALSSSSPYFSSLIVATDAPCRDLRLLSR